MRPSADLTLLQTRAVTRTRRGVITLLIRGTPRHSSSNLEVLHPPPTRRLRTSARECHVPPKFFLSESPSHSSRGLTRSEFGHHDGTAAAMARKFGNWKPVPLGPVSQWPVPATSAGGRAGSGLGCLDWAGLGPSRHGDSQARAHWQAARGARSGSGSRPRVLSAGGGAAGRAGRGRPQGGIAVPLGLGWWWWTQARRRICW
jgi:hypothetical protein